MDKNTIKKYAVWARRELIERVSQRAMIYGTTAKDAGDPNAESVNGHLLSQAEKRQRQALIRNIKEKGYEQVMEEVAYTWFNRFAALRFMEVNGYLPSHVRVFTNDAGEFKPQILAEAIHLELDGLDMNKVYELENANKTEELYKYLLIVQCNALNGILPGLFQRIEDYTELLLPDYLLREGSVVEQMVTMIPEKDWTDQVQIIGWLYQYYNTEPKDKVFTDLKKNIKITKENIPAATQLFTPDWIVHYMVENSLGRLWLEGHPNDALKSEWKYYLDEAEQEPEVQAQLAAIRKEYAALKPEEICVIDPCMGSGHILCVLFDVLVRIYEDYGYTTREAAVKIIENNLWGLDIDERAAQLAYFAVMMKARQYDRRFFGRNIQPHVYSIVDSGWTGGAFQLDMGNFLLSKEHQETLNYLLDVFRDAKEYGSILKLEDRDYQGLKRAWTYTACQTAENVNMLLWYSAVEMIVPQLIEQAIILTQKYDVVVTNPPYMGNSSMNSRLSDYVKKTFPAEKTDLFACFISKGIKMLKRNGFCSMVTMQSWMFLSSFEKMRRSLFASTNITSLLHMDNMVMGIAFGTAVSVFRNSNISGFKGTFNQIKLTDIIDDAPKAFPMPGNRSAYASTDNFLVIPGVPIAYWASKQLGEVFVHSKNIAYYADVRIGMGTGDNDRFLKEWWEVSFSKIGLAMSSVDVADESNRKFFPYGKGGECRRWYGNQQKVVWYNCAGRLAMKNTPGHRENGGLERYFQKSLTWSYNTNGAFNARFMPCGFVFDVNGSSVFPQEDLYSYILAFLLSTVCRYILSITNATITTQAGNIRDLPLIIGQKETVDSLANNCISSSKLDWDSFETSWDFQCHPLIRSLPTVRESFDAWAAECEERFRRLKSNEEELNRIFIDIYGLQDELTPEVADKDVNVRRADLGRDIRSLISYAVGCMFGRYSLDKPGLVYAGGEWNQIYRKDRLVDENGRPITFGGLTLAVGDEYTYVWDSDHWVELSFSPDKDNIIPICDDDYFEDDITGKFIKWVEVVFSKGTLEENLKFIADALGGKGSSREVIRNYFLNDFYADHLKIYQKRPIYWLFDSGKKNGFKCLIYMHRYQPDTIARIRTDYVHEQQSRYRTAIAGLEQRINGASTSERVKLNKQLQKLQAQAEEIRVYEEKIHHLADQMIKIDLDDGVKHNYVLFQDVLAKIK